MITISPSDVQNFRNNSVLFVRKLFDPLLCEEALNYFLLHEESILTKYREDGRGLAVDRGASDRIVIKYFEYPLYECPRIFGKFINSRVFDIASHLIGEPMHLVSCEIHSRSAGGTEIPHHQDNAYYGLENANALTFYVALNSQTPELGGLQYISNHFTREYPHIPSTSSAFSLTLNSLDPLKESPILAYTYQPGDCTVHHSCSVHSAPGVPLVADRSLVFRMTLYSMTAVKRAKHDEWYQEMIAINRKHNTIL